MKRIFLLFPLLCFTQFLIAQVTFTDASVKLIDEGFRSFQAMATADMNNDGLDDIIRVGLPTGASNGRLQIEFQKAGGSFGPSPCANCLVGMTEPYGIAIGDVDQNGFPDIIYGGDGTSVKYAQANATGTNFNITSFSTTGFLQGINFLDIDRDGDIDVFGCNENGANIGFENTGNSLTPNNNLIMTDNSGGNHASLWSDYDNDGDLDLFLSKSKDGVTDPTATERLNRLYKNMGAGTFTDVSLSLGLQDGEQTRAADFADIDNDGDLDLFVLNHTGSCQLYEQTGAPLLNPGEIRSVETSGVFTSIISASGISTDGSNKNQSVFADFDNDGYQDLLISGVNPTLYMNNGDRTFSPIPLTAMGAMQNFTLGDYNDDGYIDIFASYGSGGSSATADKMYLNDGNSNNYLCFDIEGSTRSNSSAIGTKLLFYGAWGVQVREIRAGESYGIQNSNIIRFGINNFTSYDSLVIQWPSGPKQIVTGLLRKNHCYYLLEGHPVLAVELVDFNAVIKEEKVLLTWQTAEEEGHDYFEVQQSTDGINFRTIGEVYEIESEGVFKNYQFIDERPSVGNNYYRLKINDVDGQFEYSEIRVVKTDFRTQISLAPNPIRSGQALSVQVILPESRQNATMRYELYDLAGRQLLVEERLPNNGLSAFALNSFGLPAGVYFLRFTFDGKHPEVEKFIIMD